MNIRMEEMCRAGHMGRGAELSFLLWVRHSPSISICSPAQKLSEHHTVGILWRIYHTGMMDHELHFQPIYLLKRMGGQAENSKLLIMAWSSVDQPLSRNPPQIFSLD